MSVDPCDNVLLVVIGVFWLKLAIYGTFYSKDIFEQLEVNKTF